MYTLQSTTTTTRTYRSTITGTDVTTSILYTDASGNKWWAFDDLLQIPHIRKMAANNISQLYGQGFTSDDLKGFAARLKTLLRSTDGEKYEKAYSEVLTLESIAASNLDPVKQELGLCSVYILSDEERVDTFSTRDALTKMEQWALDLDAQAFFLTWLSAGMNDYRAHYNSIMQTASLVKK
jgi:hypothetical protein